MYPRSILQNLNNKIALSKYNYGTIMYLKHTIKPHYTIPPQPLEKIDRERELEFPHRKVPVQRIRPPLDKRTKPEKAEKSRRKSRPPPSLTR